VPLESGGCALDKLGVFRDPEIELRILCAIETTTPHVARRHLICQVTGKVINQG
jgi:hypothetical protein